MGYPQLVDTNEQRAETVALIDFYRESEHIPVTKACAKANCPDGSYYNWKNRSDLRPLIKDAKLALTGKVMQGKPIPPSPLSMKDVVKNAIAEHFPHLAKNGNGNQTPIIEENPVAEDHGEASVEVPATALPSISHTSTRAGTADGTQPGWNEAAGAQTTAAPQNDKTLLQAVKDLRAKLAVVTQERDALNAMLGDILVKSRLKAFTTKLAAG